MPNKIDIIREYISDKITDVSTVQYDLDIREITIPDIFRDINDVYPIGTRERDNVCLLSKRITEYLIKNFADYMPKFKEFYVRYLYDDYEKVRSSLTDYGFDIV